MVRVDLISNPEVSKEWADKFLVEMEVTELFDR